MIGRRSSALYCRPNPNPIRRRDSSNTASVKFIQFHSVSQYSISKSAFTLSLPPSPLSLSFSLSFFLPISLYLFLSLSLSLSISFSLYLFLSLFLSLSFSFFPSLSLSVCLPAYNSNHLQLSLITSNYLWLPPIISDYYPINPKVVPLNNYSDPFEANVPESGTESREPKRIRTECQPIRNRTMDHPMDKIKSNRDEQLRPSLINNDTGTTEVTRMMDGSMGACSFLTYRA